MAEAEAEPDHEGRPDSIDAFFVRCHLPPETRDVCLAFARNRFPDSAVHESTSQGYCSYTVCVGINTVVQFRPSAHQLDVQLADAARDVYGPLAPETLFLGTIRLGEPAAHEHGRNIAARGVIENEGENGGADSPPLYVYSMTRILGISHAESRTSAQDVSTPGDRRSDRESLIRDFARFISLSWKSRHPASDPALPGLRGVIGSSLGRRLELMRESLPPRFRPAVQLVHANLARIEALPWVLTHGDVVPTNIIVEPGSATAPVRLTGLLDWAEAEYLPFGVGLYGAEELLGESISARDSPVGGSGSAYPPPGSCFAYYPEAAALRAVFWAELERAVPELREDEALRTAVEMARVLGLLLWHGIAFDNGKLDRVVEEGRDDEEIQRLDLFLAEYVGNLARDGSPTVAVVEDQAPPGLGRDPEPERRRRTRSFGEVVRRTWDYLWHMRMPGPVFGRR